MRKHDARRMQKISRQRLERPAPGMWRLRRAIKRIAHHGVSQCRKMDADLVRAPGVQVHFHQRVTLQPRQHAPVRARGAAVAPPRSHARAMVQIARDRQADGPRVLLQPAMHQRQVSFLYLPCRELPAQCGVHGVIPRHHQHPRSIFIQAVHDARPQRPRHAGERSVAVQQRVHHGSAGVARAGMHDHPGMLVEHQHVVIFIENLERQILGNSFQRRPRQHLHFDGLPVGQAVGAFGFAAIHADAAFGD